MSYNPLNTPLSGPNGPQFSSAPMNGQSSGECPAYELSLGETLQLQAQWAMSGFIDSLRWDIVVRIVMEDAEIRANVLKSTLLNILSLIVIYAFDLFLVPLLGLTRSQIDMDEFSQPEHWLHRNVSVAYTLLFQVPVVAGALYLNSSWSAVVAKRIYSLQHGRTPNAATSFSTVSSSHDRILTTLSSNAYRAVLIMTTVMLSFVLGYVPLVGPAARFLFMCWVDAYYCFEFIWTSRGHSLPQRLKLEEERWAYFLAFGLLLCACGDPRLPTLLFSLFSSLLASSCTSVQRGR
ncbi:hypothetical protein DL93DRAFT_2160846 [Clavulina sp. PMI_390]|nr:hypothetical protein DL93DRAFT_2160846 [Clavulina sp. PMI_390]